MSTLGLAGCLIVLALAGFAHGVFGIGFAMIATPFLALFLDYRSAVFLSAVPLLFIALWWLFATRNSLRHSGVPLTVLPAVALGAACGVVLQVSLPERVSLLLLAALLAASVAMPWALHRWRGVDVGRVQRGAPLFGLCAGVTEAALNVGAPFMVLYGTLGHLSRLQQLLALNLCFFVGKSIQLGLAAFTPAIEVDPVALIGGTVLSVLCYVAGDRLAGRFSEVAFRRALRNFLLCMVGALVVRSAFAA